MPPASLYAGVASAVAVVAHPVALAYAWAVGSQHRVVGTIVEPRVVVVLVQVLVVGVVLAQDGPD